MAWCVRKMSDGKAYSITALTLRVMLTEPLVRRALLVSARSSRRLNASFRTCAQGRGREQVYQLQSYNWLIYSRDGVALGATLQQHQRYLAVEQPAHTHLRYHRRYLVVSGAERWLRELARPMLGEALPRQATGR